MRNAPPKRGLKGAEIKTAETPPFFGIFQKSGMLSSDFEK